MSCCRDIPAHCIWCNRTNIWAHNVERLQCIALNVATLICKYIFSKYCNKSALQEIWKIVTGNFKEKQKKRKQEKKRRKNAHRCPDRNWKDILGLSELISGKHLPEFHRGARQRGLIMNALRLKKTPSVERLGWFRALRNAFGDALSCLEPLDVLCCSYGPKIGTNLAWLEVNRNSWDVSFHWHPIVRGYECRIGSPFQLKKKAHTHDKIIA